MAKASDTSALNRTEILELGLLLEALLATDNPAGVFLEEWISSRQIVECPEWHVRHGEPSVTLVLRDETERAGVARWITAQELFASTTTYRQLRKGHAYLDLVFVGTPDRYVSNAWLRSPSSWYQSQWLVTSPAASTSLFICWPGHPAWRQGLLGPWAGSRSAEVIDIGPERAEIEVEEIYLETLDLFPSEASQEPAIAENRQELVDAVGYEVFSESGFDWIYFSRMQPPRPRTISSNREQIEFLKPDQLRPGALLIVTEETALPEVLDTYTRKYWSDHYGSSSIDQAELAKRDLKNKVSEALDKFGKEEFIRRISGSGLDPDYARAVLGNILIDDYIAPRRRDALEHLQRAGEFNLIPDTGPILRHLRVARQQAGIAINELLRKTLISADGDAAMGLAEQQGWCALDTPNLGRISAHRITATVPSNRSVPKSWLGQPRGNR
jgi:hypothetical protein